MGNNTSNTIAINLDRTNDFYFSGEYVSGSVNLNIMEGKLEANEINLTLIGEIGYTTTQTISSGKGRTSTQTKYHHIPFYSAKAIFARPDLGQKELVYNQGHYSWPFQILLTEHLPPTLNQPQSYPHVRYYLQVMIEKT